MRHVVRRLTEPELLILSSLASEPRHGYALIKDIETFAAVRLSTGTLFGAIRRMLEDRWIEPFEQKDTSRDKQAYRLTSTGRAALNAELRRLQKLSDAIATRLGAPTVRLGWN